MKAWETFLSQLDRELGRETVNQWLRPFRILKFDARNLHLEGRDSFQILWFKEHAAMHAKHALVTNEGKPIELHFYLEGSPYKDKKAEAQPAASTQFFSPDHLESHATFDSFMGKSEKNLPLEILRDLLHEDKRGSYNPIYIYGPKGSGKSHLLMATAHALTSQGVAAFYVRSETFTEHVIRAFRSTSLQEFRKAYRDIEVLLIDDVHLFSRKTTTQEELFHTFNRLHTAGFQIILSANCPPRNLKDIEERLVSRFEWGLTLPLLPPSLEEKKLILSDKMHHLGLHFSPSLQTYLLETFQNLHTLIRAVEALALRSQDSESFLDLEIAQVLLKDLIAEETETLLSPEKILKAVAESFGIKTEDILGRSQNKECVLPRQIAMYLCREQLNVPYKQIGELFSRDHSTVISSVRLITKGIEQKKDKVTLPLRDISRQLIS